MSDTSRMKPDFNVYLDGTRLDGEAKGAISGVRVYLTHAGASAFEIVVDDPELRWQAKPTFTECREVQIELGVPGKMKKVFDGEATAWRTELERSGPTVLVVRGMDRSHRLMRGHKTKTFADASPLDCAKQIASAAGLSAKTSAGQPSPVKTYRLQSNESDFTFLRKMADLEGYLFYVDGSDLHFERPKLSSKDDVTVTFGEDVKTFLPVANFRRPAAKVEASAWDSTGKAALTGKAKPGDELWSVPGGKPGADVSKFQGTKANVGVVEPQVATQEHADTVAKAALTKRSLEFLTAEVEVQGNPEIKPGAMVNVKKVGVYSGHYLVTEANHFYDAAGYNCIFYVARDKWGDSSVDEEKKKKDSEQKKQSKSGSQAPYKPKAPPPKTKSEEAIDFTVQGDDGKPLANVKCKVKLKSGEVLAATTDSDGHVHIDKKPEGPYTVEITGDVFALTSIDIVVEDAEGAPLAGATGKVKLSDETEIAVTADADGKVHLEDVPSGEYTFTLDKSKGGDEKHDDSAEASSESSETSGGSEAKAPASAPPTGGTGEQSALGKETRPATVHGATAVQTSAHQPAPVQTTPTHAATPAQTPPAHAATAEQTPVHTATPVQTTPAHAATPVQTPAAPPPGSATVTPVASPTVTAVAPPPGGTAPATIAKDPRPVVATGGRDPVLAPAPGTVTMASPPAQPVAAPPPPVVETAAAPAAPASTPTVAAAPAAAAAPTGAAPPAAQATTAAPPPAEGVSPVEIGAIGSGAAAVASVSAGIASAADEAESVKRAGKSVSSADSENIEE